jgi:translation initiation factor IF-3
LFIDKRRPPSPTGNNKLRINSFIRAKEIRVIGAEGDQLGILSVRDALIKADEAALDLVEVAPTANPPVCRIMDFGKYKYEQSKKVQGGKAHSKATHLKEMQLRPFTGEHDLDFKVRHAKEFLESKQKVKITLMFRGREMSFQEKGRDIMAHIEQQLIEVGQLESPLKKEGRNLVMIVAPKAHTTQKKIKQPKDIDFERNAVNEAKT